MSTKSTSQDGLTIENTEQRYPKEESAFQAGQRQYLEMLATGADFFDTLHMLIRIIEEQSPGMLGLVLLLDKDGEHLHIGASESLPKEYLNSIEGLKIGPKVGSCGTASYLGERVIVEDIATDHRWEGLRDLALKYDLRACWSDPIFSSNGKVVGTFAMYYQHRRSPTEEELRTIEIGAYLAGIAIQRKRADESLIESQRRLSTLISNLPGMAYRCKNDREWTMEFVSQGSKSLTGYPPEALIGNREISYGELVHPDDIEKVWQEVQTALEEERPFQLRYRLNTRDGEKWVWEQGQGIADPEGHIVALEGFITDITAQVDAQQNLEQSVSKRTRELSTLLEISHNLASTLDLDQLLGLILDHLGSVVAYDAVSIMILEDDLIRIMAYRGPIPQEEALQIQFPIRRAAANREVIQRREPVIIEDIHSKGAMAQAIRAMAGDQLETTYGYLRCWMGVPLIFKDRVVGMLTLDHQEPGYYTNSQAALAMAFANQVAVAIVNARLYLETERRADESEALFSVQQAITSKLEMADVLQMIADEARRLTNTDISAVYLLEGNELVITYVSGDVPDSIRGYRLSLDESIAGRVLTSRESILVQDTWTDPRVDREASDQVNARSLLIVPMVAGEETIGTITVANRTPGGFSSEDERLLTTLATNVVISLENARLYQAEHDRRQVAEGLRDILAVLNSNRSLEEILQHIVTRAAGLSGADGSAIYSLDADEEIIKTLAKYRLPGEFDTIDALPLADTPPQQAIMNGERFIVSDLSPKKLEDVLPGLQSDRIITIISNHYRALQVVPLIVKGAIYGAIALYYRNPHDFTEDAIGLTMTFADQAALAIENAQLRAQVEKTAVAAERDRLARDLHDAVTQTLFSTSLIAEVLPRIWEEDPEQGKERLEEIRSLTRGALAEMRSLLMELRPSALVETDLPDLLRQLVQAFTGRSGVPVELNMDVDCDIPEDVKVVVYRVLQESLNNIDKHARASSCTVNLRCQDGQLTLEVIDDGKGFAPQEISTESLGVGIMRDRAEKIGGDIDITSKMGEGTKIKLIWNQKKRG